MRNITIFSTRGSRRNTIQSDATTWGELQADLSDAEVEYSGFKAIVSSTQNTLESLEAQLPEGDFTLMLIPGKVKSGTDYAAMRYNDLRRLATQRGIEGLNVPPTKEELIERLEENDDVIVDVEDEDFNEVSVSSEPTVTVESLNIETELDNITASVASSRRKLANTSENVAVQEKDFEHNFKL